MKKLLLIGAGGHATSCIDVIKSTKKFKVSGVVINKHNQNYTKLEHIGNDQDLQKLRKNLIMPLLVLVKLRTSY